MRAVNLLPREAAGRQRLRKVDPLLAGGIAVTVVVVAAVASGFVVSRSHAASEQHQLAAARVLLAAAQAQAAKPGTAHPLATPAVVGQQQTWQTALNTALATRVPWDNLLSELARVVPSNVTLTTVTLGSTGSGVTPVAGSTGVLTIGGTAFSEDGVAQLLARLGLVPTLTQVTLTSSSADPKTGIVTFTVSAQVQGVATAFSTEAPAAPATTTTTTTPGATS